MEDKTRRYIHEEAIKFRNKKRRELVNGEIPDEHLWIYKKMEEFFPND